MKHWVKSFKNIGQAGQATMEAVLILVIIVGLTSQISRFAKGQEFVRKLVEGPWEPIRGMIEDGVWVRYTNSKPLHPNHKIRHQSKSGDQS